MKNGFCCYSKLRPQIVAKAGNFNIDILQLSKPLLQFPNFEELFTLP